ncbi:GIY-YIG nuclease family protein [Brevibacillus centrosporus]|uniref:GIY-YIG nuclease family protein n=1 Tax=Brevibacillus centrosporus TaxID=54910 RepID=UPI00116B420D|nr:GIY-YIG nuclease family protein [Brevibacillus centrosporus]MEC2133483.1 GIY-YIG nuclease family protein [Brevibacillus centrosporus]GED34998.1 chromosome segregation ATPase [Brevibacillus centrosporus]
MFKRLKELFQVEKTILERQTRLNELGLRTQELNDKEESLQKSIELQTLNLDKLKSDTIAEALKSIEKESEEIIKTANEKAENILANAHSELTTLGENKVTLTNEIDLLKSENEKVYKELTKYQKIAKKHKVESLGIQKLIEKFPFAIDFLRIEKDLEQLKESFTEEGLLETVIHLDLHHKNSKMLRSEMNANNKEIKKLLATYQSRYTTKANATIYELMVIGLQAELQNILFTLSYSNLDKALENSKTLINRYLLIAGNGNANILPTVTRFLSELEPLFENAIRIEYKYYYQKELEKEEQRRIKEQMRLEAEERKLLEEERKKIEKEEEKYLNEIAKNKELLSKETDNDKMEALMARIQELEQQCDQLEEKKEEITKRANGKAGYVYVISNFGSFGERMFKVGMTRRLDPMDRIDELGDASVPFKFDVHAMIFSDDAVGLEQKLHNTLNYQRVNMINFRKEFFYAGVEELQTIVHDIDPTVEFTTTMIAIEYRQSETIRKEGTFQSEVIEVIA